MHEPNPIKERLDRLRWIQSIADQRDPSIIDAYEAGATQAQIAEALGVTRVRVTQVISKHRANLAATAA